MLYVQLLAFPLLAWAGWRAGKTVCGTPWWGVGVAVCLCAIGLVMAGNRVPRLSAMAPFSWAVDGDVNPFLTTVVVAGLFGILIPRLPAGRTAPAARVAMGAMAIYYGLMPAVMALVTQAAMGSVPTRIDANGICRQTTGYTCGPAAAVTCLINLGEFADERTLAADARSSPSFGTDGHVLGRTLERLFPRMRCEYRYFESLEELPLPAVAECYVPGIGGHYVAVLGLEKDRVVVGDPLKGRQLVLRESFLGEWKGTALVFEMRRKGNQFSPPAVLAEGLSAASGPEADFRGFLNSR